MTDDGVPRTDEELVGFCRSLGLPDEWLRAVLHHNGARLLARARA